jgi:hypothetical protein
MYITAKIAETIWDIVFALALKSESIILTTRG